MTNKVPSSFEEELHKIVYRLVDDASVLWTPELERRYEAEITALATRQAEALAEVRVRELENDLPHSIGQDNSLEIWSWKTPTGRKWIAAYINNRRRPLDIFTGDTIAEALELLAAHLKAQPSNKPEEKV